MGSTLHLCKIVSVFGTAGLYLTRDLRVWLMPEAANLLRP
jgi:hypothetical protein